MYKEKEYICQECNKPFKRIRTTSYIPKFCTKQCSNANTAVLHRVSRKGSGNPSWKGGRKVVQGGYIKLHRPEHPNSDNKGYIFEHRLVMEKKIGRYLFPFETVHHKNGVRSDNRPKNLQLFVSKHPPGQTPEDLIIWAKEILSIYDK